MWCKESHVCTSRALFKPNALHCTALLRTLLVLMKYSSLISFIISSPSTHLFFSMPCSSYSITAFIPSYPFPCLQAACYSMYCISFSSFTPLTLLLMFHSALFSWYSLSVDLSISLTRELLLLLLLYCISYYSLWVKTFSPFGPDGLNPVCHVHPV